mgnify:CR=1 FL=1
MRYAGQKRRATTRQQYALGTDYNKVLKDAKRIHRDDEVFYIVTVNDGWYASVSHSDYKIYNYQPNDILQHWKFEGTRWKLVEDNME